MDQLQGISEKKLRQDEPYFNKLVNILIQEYNDKKQNIDISKEDLDKLLQCPYCTENQYLMIFDIKLQTLIKQKQQLTQPEYKLQIPNIKNNITPVLNKLSYLFQAENQFASLKLLQICKNLNMPYDIDRYVALLLYTGQYDLIPYDNITSNHINDLINSFLRKSKSDYEQYLDKYAMILLEEGLYGFMARGTLFMEQVQQKIYVNQKYYSLQEIKQEINQTQLPLNLNEKLPQQYLQASLFQ